MKFSFQESALKQIRKNPESSKKSYCPKLSDARPEDNSLRKNKEQRNVKKIIFELRHRQKTAAASIWAKHGV